MSNLIAWIAAEAERPEVKAGGEFLVRRRKDALAEDVPVQALPAHQYGVGGGDPHFSPQRARREMGHPAAGRAPAVEESAKDVEPAGEKTQGIAEMVDACDEIREAYERERRIYRRRTVAMLRRYMRYSIETGRLPSLLGREFFRAKVTSYTVVTFEDRVIFVHDMETCLERLDEFSRQLIARHILQEHDQLATARLLHCTERTVRRLTPFALDQMSDILLEIGLMERLEPSPKNSCQGGREGQNVVSDCEDREILKNVRLTLSNLLF